MMMVMDDRTIRKEPDGSWMGGWESRSSAAGRKLDGGTDHVHQAQTSDRLVED